ncbi:MAG: phosphoglycerate dehydrogenase [Hymenobacteraceae bacterium]|nr:phosphoglycerate dehydrogenase [Hymenobacteraceae bacterium]
MTSSALPTLVIDFDSTFCRLEALDELAALALADQPDGAARLTEIRHLTELAMAGELSFGDALRRRVALLGAHRRHIAPLVAHLQANVSESIRRNKTFFIRYADRVRIVSSGFREIIEPVVAEFGIPPENVFANTFTYDAAGAITGFDAANPLANDQGKITLLRTLDLPGDVYVLGDGWTDYEIRQAGLADRFYAYTENVERPRVVEAADHVLPSFDEFLYQQKYLLMLPMTLSYPKSRLRVLLLENIHPEAERLFREQGFPVESVKGALSEEELMERIKGVSILGIRSKTQVTARVLDAADRLLAVGAFCIGTNQIDLQGCLTRGIAAFNAPFSNTRSVVELALGQLIMLARRVPYLSPKMHRGEWDKSAGGAFEVRGKTLGIVGYGNIGAQLSVVAEAIGMRVVFYDIAEKLILGNAIRVHALSDLLRTADIVTLHVDGRAANTNLVGAAELALMKPGALLLNLSRGHIVDLDALAESIKSGHLGGASVDVFPYEPKTNDEPFESPLRGLPNVLITPHIGGSTAEAQFNIGQFVPGRILDYINTGNTQQSVNFPIVQLPQLQNAHRLLHIHANVPGILARINQILASHEINIVGQYLKTNESIGYVITDVEAEYSKELTDELRAIPQTIRFRVLY